MAELNLDISLKKWEKEIEKIGYLLTELEKAIANVNEACEKLSPEDQQCIYRVWEAKKHNE